MKVGKAGEAEAKPEASIRRVPLAELRDALPSDTPQVDSRQRTATLERRRRAVWSRYRR